MASQFTVRLSPLPGGHRARPLVDPRGADRDALYFPAETYPLLTDFRGRVVNYIYLRTRDMSGKAFTSAWVEISDEDDLPVLDLTLVIDADWVNIQALRQDVAIWLSQWAEEWTDQERTDFADHIHFSMIPRRL